MTEELVATPEREGKHMEFSSTSAAETIQIGHEIAELLRPPKLLILTGTLGAGKTTLVKGIADALHAADPDEVTSPTFTLIHEYEGTRLVQGREEPVYLYHLDLYRLETERQVEALGIEELLADDDAIVLVEWGEKFPSILRRSNGEIRMESSGGEGRKINLTLR